jgi:formylglycine-generating enzyme required for sulfatase activity
VRLPTEAEWEYACRGGTQKNKTAFWFGDGEEDLSMHAWYHENAGDRTHSLEESLSVDGHANQLELFDMHGNVSEWCSDWYGNYDPSMTVNPIGPLRGSFRVLRGGSWGFLASNCRSADRDRGDPSYRLNYLGFRLLLSPSVK